MKCKQCNQDFPANKNNTRLFCNDACKVAHNRKDGAADPMDGIAPLKVKRIPLEDVCSPEELKEYPNECDTKKEYAESIYRLENNALALLRVHGIFIPNKYNKNP